MNLIMKENLKLLAWVLMLVFFAVFVPCGAVAEICLHNTDREALKNYKGSYINSKIIDNIKKNRDFLSSIDKNEPIDEISIMENGKVQYGDNYHEGWFWDVNDPTPEECIIIIEDKNTIILRTAESSPSGRKVDNKYIRDTKNFLFNILFQGCFEDSQKEKWCFKDGNILINGKEYHASLHYDGSEISGKGNILDVYNESLFWVLIPTENGWKIYKTDWMSKEGVEHMDIDKPWKILIRK